MVFEKNYANQTGLLLRICLAVVLGKINGAKERSDHHNNLVLAAGGYFHERAEPRLVENT